MTAAWDVYLNGQGYQLAKDGRGRLVSGAARSQYTNPFMRHLSADEQYVRVPFRFGDGGGLAEYDGSNRYESAEYADTRGGRLIGGTQHHLCAEALRRVFDEDDMAAVELSNGAGDLDGVAEKFQVPAAKTGIRNVAILVRRQTGDYGAETGFTVEIWDHDGVNNKPNAQQATVTVSQKKEADAFLPFPDRWGAEEWFWLEVTFANDVTVVAEDYYWLVVLNGQAYPLEWAEDEGESEDQTRSEYNGAAWSNGDDTSYPLMYKMRYVDEIDGFPRCFCEFRGTDDYVRMYAGLANKVMYYDLDNGWTNSQVLDAPVLQLIVFNSLMFACQGPDDDIYYSNGATGATVWTQLTGEQAQCMAIHDSMLWKADGSAVGGSVDGTTWTGADGTVGDPGTPVMSMISHGGSLFAAKPEGIFEVTYPDTYPTSGTPVGNSMLDFMTEIAPRTWILDWHSGLYFPGYGGVYELKGGILRNLWTDKIDEGAMEISEAGQQFTRPRRWGPVYDADPGHYTAAIGTTRGLYMAYVSPYLAPPDLWIYNGQDWHQLGPLWCEEDDNSLTAVPALAEYCMALHLQSYGGGKGRLWYGLGMNIGYWEWPTWTNDRTQDEDAEWGNYGCSVWLPRFSLPEKNQALSLCRLGITNKGMAQGQIAVAYSLDGAAWKSDLTGTPAAPYYELIFPASTSCREVQLRVLLTSWNGTDAIEQIDLMYQPLTESYQTHQLIIQAAEGQALHGAGVDTRSAAAIIEDLEALPDLGSFTYVDPVGASHTVRVTGLSIQHQRQINRPGATLPTEAKVIISLLEL